MTRTGERRTLLTLAAGPAASRLVHLNLDAWSVNATSTGLVELTVRELQGQALLEQTSRSPIRPARHHLVAEQRYENE